MCGIAGILSLDPARPPISLDELVAIRDAMATRGPDSAGLWHDPDGRIGLAHRRLAIIDLSRAADQPMRLAGRDIHIVFHGEISNYRALRAELVAQGREFRTRSDTEVLLHLYARDGMSMVERLRGMFAFAIWDGERRTFSCARDPFGILPFYYSTAGGQFRFASQLKALARGGGVEDQRETAAIVGYHVLGYVPEPFTMLASVVQLPAGTTLVLEPGKAPVLTRYFDPATELDAVVGSPELAPAEARAIVHDALRESVRHALVADVPVGIFLSAGRDSTAILALANECGAGDIRTITVGVAEYRGSAQDETAQAAATAAHFGAHHETRWLDQAVFAESHDRLLDAMDQPSIDGVNSFLVSRMAAEAGLKVVLSGIGGDELFGGYPNFRQVPRLTAMLKPLRPLRFLGAIARRLAAPGIGSSLSPKYASLLEYGTSYEDAYLLRRALFLPWELDRFLDPDLVAEGWRRLDLLSRLSGSVPARTRGHARISALELSWYMRNQLLRDMDWAGLAHSLEVRPPFLDVALFRALARLIVSRKPPTKDDVMRSLPNPPPDAVRGRSKTGFVVPMGWWQGAGRAEAPRDPWNRGLRPWARHVFAQWRPRP